MHLFLQLLLTILASSLLLFLITKTRKNGIRKYSKPPGPPGFLVIGNLHQYVSSCPHIYFHELSKTYGPLMSLKLGFVPILVVSSAKMAKEVLKTHDHIFCSRPKFANLQKLSFNGLSITFSPYGDYWRNIRKVAVVHLLSSRMVQSFSSIREDEVFQSMQRISSLSEPVNLNEMMMSLINTLICRIAFGRREDGNDDGDGDYRSRIRVMLKEIQEKAVSFCLSDCFPFMGWFDKLKGLSCDKVFMELDSLLEEVIEEHEKTTRTKSGPVDIVDVLIRLQKDNSVGFVIARDQIKAILMDVFVAGTDTSAATIVWAMTELIQNPKAMAQVQEETRTLMSNNNTTKMIKEEDLGKLVYLKAVVKETLRLHPVAPLLVPREASQSCVIEGYEIQEKTIVFLNAWAIGRDPESWESPEEFKPERFLCDKPLDFGGQDFEFIPFGSGRRICPGMHMGVAMVELALANLIYLFDWVVPIGMEKDVINMNPLPGITTHKKIPLCLLAENVVC